MKKSKCDQCGFEFSNKGGNFTKHTLSCDGTYLPYSQKYSGTCKHCETQFDLRDKPKGWMANHSRWCISNPKRNSYINDMSRARSEITVDSRSKAAEAIKLAHDRGCYDSVDHRTFLNKKHSDETKQVQREKALASPHRRLVRGIVEYKGILLDSSWELALAVRLDDLGIVWTRPAPLKWIDAGGTAHNYFPDFYLPEYDLYLDPKNPQAVRVQQEKLNILLTMYKNLVIIETLDECKEFNPTII